MAQAFFGGQVMPSASMRRSRSWPSAVSYTSASPSGVQPSWLVIARIGAGCEKSEIWLPRTWRI